MARGKNQSKSKKSGIQRFLDALLCCCGKRRSGKSKRHYSPYSESTDLAESEIIIENTTTNDGAGSPPEGATQPMLKDTAENPATECAAATNEPVAEAIDCELAGKLKATASEPEEEAPTETRGTPPDMGECAGQTSTETDTPNDVDGFIDVRGLAVLKEIRHYRKEILVDVDILIEEFKYQGTKYLHLVHDADLDEITVTTNRGAEESAVEVTSNGRTYMLHVMDDGGVQVMKAVWDSASDLWYNKTYLMTYWGLELISQAAV